jgi:hypothetical protein
MSKESLLTAHHSADVNQNTRGQLTGKPACSVSVFKEHLYLTATYSHKDNSHDYSRILRFNPKIDSWEELYEASLANSTEKTSRQEPLKLSFKLNTLTNRHYIYSEMVVFKGKSNASPALYVSVLSSAGAKTLRSEDGITFDEVPQARLEYPEGMFFRPLVTFQDRVYASALKRVTDEELSWKSVPLIYISDEPTLGDWQEVNLPGFDDSNNQSISPLTVFNNYLYAATINQERGFQIWKAQVSNQSPYTWEQVMSNGAHKYTQNQLISSMVVFKGNLYVASGMLMPSDEQTDELRTAPPELIRIYIDDSWDLIAGTPRFTPHGLKVPLSGMGPGFDDLNTSAFSCMFTHNERLYLGVQKLDTFQVWMSEDGEIWTQPFQAKLSNYSNAAFCTGMSTSLGIVLVFKTASPQNLDDTSSNGNEDDGLEVWIDN